MANLADIITLKDKAIKKIKSGFSLIDDLVDFRSGNSYLLAGYEKSGKSSFALGIIVNLLKQNKKMAFFNTELTDGEFLVALTALGHGITKKEAEEKPKLQEVTAKLLENNLYYAGISQLSKDGKLNFDMTMKLAQEAIDFGAEVFFFDNLTTYASQTSGGQKGWEVLAGSVSNVLSFTKLNNITSFIVIHTKPETVFNETPTGIRKLVDANETEKVFEKSVTVVRRPSGNDIYGGGGIRSQVSGTILIWRPFQLFDQKPHLQILTQIILENFRHTRGGSARYEFEGARGRFKEDLISQTLEANK